MPSTSLLLASVGLAILVAPASAQLLTVDHPGQYTQEDIAAGGLFYNAHCVQCHGRDGDQISGIDLRRGLFRRSQSDEDLAQTITRGTPGGHAAVQARIRRSSPASSRSSAPASTRARPSSRRRRTRASGLPGQGRVRHVPPRGRQGPALGAGSERHRDRARARDARTLGPRSVLGAAADQPAGADRDDATARPFAAAG